MSRILAAILCCAVLCTQAYGQVVADRPRYVTTHAEVSDSEGGCFVDPCPVPLCDSQHSVLAWRYEHEDLMPGFEDEYGFWYWSDSSIRRETWICRRGHEYVRCWDNKADGGPCDSSPGTPIPELAFFLVGRTLVVVKGGR
jgi:hypothetical protein